MNDFRNRLKIALDNCPDYNSRTLSVAAGLGEKTISNLIANASTDTTPKGPGLFAMSRVATLLDVSLDWLAGRPAPAYTNSDDQAEFARVIQRLAHASAGQLIDKNVPPSPQAFQRLFVRSGAQLKAFEDIIDYCDQYELCSEDATNLTVIRIGALSLSANTMGCADTHALQVALNSPKTQEIKRRLIADHIAAAQRGCMSTVENLDIQMPNRPVRVRMDYIRNLAAVTNEDGEKIMLCYCCPIL